MAMDLAPRRFADAVVLSPAGRIDHATAGAFEAALLAHLARCAPGQDGVVLDLSGVEYVASVGLRALMVASRQAKAQGGALLVAGLQPVVREIFEISRFTLILTTCPSVRAAVARVSPAALAAFDAA
jgi:anti-sigma B factor antagonist/stage II sporulation protein AA (anti-sigma F factor antagonist)